jgi:hypothetical protein
MATSRITATLGVLFNRLLIPGWLLTGALFKLYYRDPQSLPESIWKTAHAASIDLDVLLRGIIGIEFVIAGIMFFSARFARPVAIALMSLFCLILLWELRVGAASCGCLGKVTMPPWLMLAIDVPLLLGAIFFKPPRPQPHERGESNGALRPWPIVAALMVLIVSFGAAFGVPNEQVAINDDVNRDASAVVPPKGGDDQSTASGEGDESAAGGAESADGGDEGDPNAGTSSPAPPPGNVQPPSYYVLEPPKWVGKHWYELEIARYVTSQPRDVDRGRRYILFYNPTCDHCYDVLRLHFAASLPAPTTVIAIPEYKTHFEKQGVYQMPCGECEKLELKFGCNWITSPPVLVALEDGIVQCAAEVQDVDMPECLLWH